MVEIHFNMIPNSLYPSKILLVGEYTVLAGYPGLAIPYFNKFAEWKFNPNQKDTLLKQLLFYIQTQAELSTYLNTEQFEADIQSGIYLESTIPFGCGLGSSGSLCAAILDRYGDPILESIESNFNLLKELENFFHGQSSGVDPAVAYFKKAIYIDKNKIKLIDLNFENLLEKNNISLIDSAVDRNTKELVDRFKQKMQDTHFKNKLHEFIIPVNTSLIQGFMNENSQQITQDWKKLSLLSFELFQDFLPSKIRTYWKTGLELETHYCKLCGAGGGGYFLVKNLTSSQESG